MWPTTQGLRTLRSGEAELIRHAAIEMLGSLEQEYRDGLPPRGYGVNWFDQWDVGQRSWLLLSVIKSLFLADQVAPSAAAMYDATVDCVLLQATHSIDDELDEPSQGTVWRGQVLRAFEAQNGRQAELQVDELDRHLWFRLIGQIGDAILANPSYSKAEPFRDSDPKATSRFLVMRGLPSDYLERIPPLCRDKQTESCLAELRGLLSP